MGRINNLIKWIVANVNFLYSAMAITAIVLAIFVLVSNWGTLDPGFFLGWGIAIILFSLIVSLMTYMGCLGVSYQVKRTGWWTGRRMLLIFQLGLVGTLVAVFYLYSTLLIITRSFKSAYDSYTAGNDDDMVNEFDFYESAVSKKFNEFYFSAMHTCTDSKYAFFWGFVDDHCPPEMSVQSCVKCYDYSITTCPADEATCFSDSSYSEQACPYNICRGPILDYLISYSEPLSGYMLFFAIFQFVLLLLNCLLICYTEQDTVEEMLIKSGTIGNGRAFQPKPRRRRRDETDDAESVGTSRHRDTETVATNRHRDTDSVGTSRHRDTESVGTISRHRHNGDDASVRNV